MPLDAPAPLLRTRPPAPKSREELTADAAHLDALILAFENARILADAYRAAMDDGDRLQRSVQGAADAFA